MAIDPVTAADMGDTPNDPKAQKTPQQVADEWLGRIQAGEKARKSYQTRGRQIIKRYKNKRRGETIGVNIDKRRMNVLWSNTQTQKPVLYAQEPKANVSRRNKTKDPIGRTASIVLQNCLQNSVAMEDFSYVLNQVVEDRLLPGSGIAMVEYVPRVEGDQIGWQAAETRYIHWEDWITNPARVWQENEFFAYKVYLTKRQCYEIALANSGDEEFAEDVWTEITLTHRPVTGDQKEGKRPSDTTGPAKAEVWVVWDLTDKQVIQISPGYPKAPLAIMSPPVSFDGFWPCPRPLQSTTTNDSTIPVPDFEQYVDQADEIDLMTQRIGVLSKALRLRGIYPADMESIKQLVEGGDMDMIPYDNWQIIQERGGAEKLVMWFPVEAIAATMISCMEARDKAIQIMYEVTGISDIMRGATEPEETATSQQLKAQFGGIRIRESQKEVQRFIRDVFRLKAEIICEHFQLDVIKAMSGIRLLTEQEKQMVGMAQQAWQQYGQQVQQVQQQAQQMGQPAPVPPPPGIPQPSEEMLDAAKEPSWEQVMKLLRDEKLRGFVVDVETDSTIEPDQNAQQQAAAAFTTAVAQFMTAALPIMQVEPDAVEFLGEIMAWTTRQWKGADTIEGAVDEFVEKMKKKVQQAQMQPPPPNPEVIKAQVDQQVSQTDAQVAQFKGQVEMKVAETDLLQTQLEHQGTMAEKAADLEIAKATPKPTSGGGGA